MLGRRVEDAVLHYDDGARLDARDGRRAAPARRFQILAVDAAGTDAWLLGGDGDGALALFQRDGDALGAAPADACPPGVDAAAGRRRRR